MDTDYFNAEKTRDNVVEFNHNYSKLCNQKSGFLCWVCEFILMRDFPEETYLYDTDGKFPLEKGKTYLQLVFLGDKEIPFTTYRDDTQENRDKYMHKEGQMFEFKIEEN